MPTYAERRDIWIKDVKAIYEQHIYMHNQELNKIKDIAGEILEHIKKYGPQIYLVNYGADIYAHCVDVCVLSCSVGVELHLADEELEHIAVGAIFHDIGLRYIDIEYDYKAVRNYNAKSLLEYKKHTIYGYSSLEKERWMSDISKEIILKHHETLDGSGYPFHAGKETLSQEVQIVSVCDAFLCMLSGLGRELCSLYEAVKYIQDNLGVLYNEEYGRTLIELVDCKI